MSNIYVFIFISGLDAGIVEEFVVIFAMINAISTLWRDGNAFV